MRIRDTFEVRDSFKTDHEPGLVVVLDTLLTRKTDWLVGCMAFIRTGAGAELTAPIAGAKDHGPVNSLFFHDLGNADVPVGSEITIALPHSSESKATAASLAS